MVDIDGRVLRPNGKLTLVLIGQNTMVFNAFYKVLGKMAPAFWGRQVEQRVPQLIELYKQGGPLLVPAQVAERALDLADGDVAHVDVAEHAAARIARLHN